MTHLRSRGPGMRRRLGDRILVGPVFPYPSRPAAGPNSLLYRGKKLSVQVVKRSGSGVDHPPPSGTEVKEREQLFLYSLSVPS